jgi:hypothetical protein
MTLLNKTVRRKCAKPFGKYHLIVQLEPGDMISMRESHSKKWYTLTLEGLYVQMVKSGIARKRYEEAQSK